MKKTLDLLEQAKTLSLTERAALIEALLNTIDASDRARDQRWVDEAESRLGAYRSGELPSTDADEVL